MTFTRVRWVIVFFLCNCVLSGAASAADEQLYSPQTGYEFHKLAYELYNRGDLTTEEASQAMVFLNAVLAVDDKADYVYQSILELSAHLEDERYFQPVFYALDKYIKSPTMDLEVASKGVQFLLGQMDSREKRENLLLRLLNLADKSNAVLASELAMQLALLAAEKTDFENAMKYYSYAYKANPYNKLAFIKFSELTSGGGEQIKPGVYINFLRLSVSADPINAEGALALADYYYSIGMYEEAAGSYEYSAKLLEYVTGQSQLPASIYIRWALSCYNTERGKAKCTEIAQQVRRAGVFDVVLEGIAAIAEERSGNSDRNGWLKERIKQAEQLLAGYKDDPEITFSDLAWYYLFVFPNNEKALAWANKAHTSDPESAEVKAIFGYALATNNTPELALEYVSGLEGTNQIAALTVAMTKLAGGEREAGLEELKSAIELDQASIIAEKAKELLSEFGSDYILPISPEAVRNALPEQVAANLVPVFMNPDEMVSAKLSFSGSEFSYDSDLNAKLIITNNSPEQLLIGSYGMLKGFIRIDAEITGDIKGSLPELIVKRVQPASAVKPNQHISIPLDMQVGSLRKILFSYPQASIELKFTLYLDPVETADGKIKSMVAGMEPVRAVVKRNGVSLNREYLSHRLDVLVSGRQGQKITAARLFAGLLAEQTAMLKSGPLYRHMQIDKAILTDAVKRALNDDDWKVRAHTIAAVMLLPRPLGYDLVESVSESLGHESWPLRMLALYLLSGNQQEGFGQVLDWTAKNDSNWVVRAMSIALGGEEPEEPVDEGAFEEQGEPAGQELK